MVGYNNAYGRELANRYTVQQYRAAENRDALNGGSLEAVGLDGSLVGSAMAMKVAPIVSKIANKLVASGYKGGNMAFVEKMLDEKFEKHGLPKSMIPTITKLINCFNSKGELNSIINALPIINAIVKPLIGGMSSISGGVASMPYEMGSGAMNGCGDCGSDCGCDCCGGNFGMSGKGISSIAQMASASPSFYDREYRPMELKDPILNAEQNRMIEGGYRTKGAKDVKKRCPKGSHIARATNECKAHRDNSQVKKELNRMPGSNWIEAHPSYSAPKSRAPKEPKVKRSNPGAQARATIVKQVMAEQGLSMIEASKYVKANGLYQPQARAKIDLGESTNLPRATRAPKPFNKGMRWEMMPVGNERPAPPTKDIFKAPKRAKKESKTMTVEHKAEPKKYIDILLRNHKLISTLKQKYETLDFSSMDVNGYLDRIFDRIHSEILALGKSIKEKGYNITTEEKREINSSNSFLLKQSKRLIKFMEIPRQKYDTDEDEVPAFMEILELWHNFKYGKPTGSGAPVGSGLQQKEELMAERNGQYVGLSKGRPGVRPKGGRKLVPIDQLPSVVGGGFFDDVGQAFRYTPFGMASDAIQGRPTVFHGD